jgi:beta-lactamase class A
MRKDLTIFYFVLIAFQTGCMIRKTPLENLKFEIEKKLVMDSARFGFAFTDVQTGNTLLINDRDNFHAASTMKTPVLIELLRQAKAGRFSMTDLIEVKNVFKSIVDGSAYSLDSTDDSELELYKQLGQRRTIADLAYTMIVQSSNLATNILIDLVTADSIMKTMKAIGANDIKVLRGVEDSKAYRQGLNNTTTAFDQMLLYDLIAKEQAVDSASSKEITRILLDQQFNEIIPLRLPADVKVAHKTGWITGIRHDTGIIFLPDGRSYVLVLLSQFRPADEKKVMKTMADVSKQVYDYMMSH